MGLGSGILGAVGGTVGGYFGGPTGAMVGGGLGTGIGGFFDDQLANRQANSYNSDEAALNRQFQMDMSNTSYRRGMADMQAAGLNPMLAFSNGGASVPTGAVASWTEAGAQRTSAAASAQSVSQQGVKVPSEIELNQTNSAVNSQRIDNFKAEAKRSWAEAGLSENAQRLSDSFLSAISAKYGNFVVHGSSQDEALAKFARATKVDPELAEAGAKVFDKMARDDIQKLLHSESTSLGMSIVQGILRAILSAKAVTSK